MKNDIEEFQENFNRSLGKSFGSVRNQSQAFGLNNSRYNYSSKGSDYHESVKNFSVTNRKNPLGPSQESLQFILSAPQI